MTVEDVIRDASPLWLLPILGVVFMVSQIAPGVIGKAGESWREWTRQARSAEREAREHRDDERNYWRGVADERLREIKARDELIASHQVWDWTRYEELVQQGKRPAMPPPLRPEVPGPLAGDGATLD